jgi:WD40 repeat protein
MDNPRTYTERIWNSETGELIRKFENEAFDGSSNSFSLDGLKFLTSSKKRFTTVWDSKTGSEIATFGNVFSRIKASAFSPDGSLVATGGEDQILRIWNANTGELVKSFSGHTSTISAITFSPDGSKILSGSSDGESVIDSATGKIIKGFENKTIKIWDFKKGILIKTIRGNTDGINSLEFSPNGLSFLARGDDNAITLYNYSSLFPKK